MQRWDRERPTTTNGSGAAGSAPDDWSLVSGWRVNRVFYLAVILSSLIAAADATLRGRVILVGALIVGPCCGLLTGRWSRTATAGGVAVLLAVVLGLPDSNFGSRTHLVYLGAVVIVTVLATSSAAVIETARRRERRRPRQRRG